MAARPSTRRPTAGSGTAPHERRRWRRCAPSAPPRAASGSSGTSDRRTTSSSACPRTPGTTDDLPADDRTWLTEARASLPTEIRERIVDLYRHRDGDPRRVVRRVPARAQDRRRVRRGVRPRADLAELLTAMLADYLRGPEAQRPRRSHDRRRSVGDRDAARGVSRPHRRLQGAARRPGDGASRSLRGLPRLGRGVPADRGDGSPPSSSATTRCAPPTARRWTPAELIETTTNGIRWLPEVGVRRVILAPSYFSRPYNFLLTGEDWRFFGYPVSDDALDARRSARAAARRGPPASGPRRRDAAADPQAAVVARPLPDRDRRSSSTSPSRRSSTTWRSCARPVS